MTNPTSQSKSVTLSGLMRARSGDPSALGKLLEHYRPWLSILAKRELNPVLGRRVSESDIVQETMLEAARDFDKCKAESPTEFIGWLRTILTHNVINTAQRHGAAKRDIGKDVSMDDSRSPLGRGLAGELSTPSQAAMRSEASVQLAQAIDSLPDDQGEAIRLRHLEGCTLAEIAARMERSEVAVAGLLKRGLKRLRKDFAGQEMMGH